jgi:hypothetical protein
MKSSIRIIKRHRNDDSSDLKTPEGEKSVERCTRDMANTVKSWIAELQERKRTQRYSFPHLTEIAATPVSHNR